MTTNKLNRVKSVCPLARYPQTFAAILNALTAAVDVSRLTAAQISGILCAMYAQKEYGYNQAAREIL